MTRVKPLSATEAEMRDMLTRIRDLLGDFGNCPFCGEVDFEEGQPINGKHEDWCVYDALMEMKL